MFYSSSLFSTPDTIDIDKYHDAVKQEMPLGQSTKKTFEVFDKAGHNRKSRNIFFKRKKLLKSEDYQKIAQFLDLPFKEYLDVSLENKEIPIPKTNAIHKAQIALFICPQTQKRKQIIAPTYDNILSLKRLLKQNPLLKEQLIIAAPQTIRHYLTSLCAPLLVRLAIERLSFRNPDFSARKVMTIQQIIAFCCMALFIPLAIYSAPLLSIFIVSILIALIFFCIVSVRLYAAQIPIKKLDDPPKKKKSDPDLPLYTVLVPMYRETSVLKQITNALNALEYPREKLDIKLLIEACDKEIQQALDKITLDQAYDIVIVPEGYPRTKPRAMAYAMPLMRGDYVVIFDAEDRPEKDQLLKALDAFEQGADNLACVQARLAPSNGDESFFARQFTAEYAGLFDVMLPVLARFHMPLPLGGTSNHFKKEALFNVGGWDPYNMTEDADLGMRLARMGWVSDVIESTTYEEAPLTFKVWFHQRTRWFKGWVQTWLVHMRSPKTLMKEMGIRDMCAFQLLMMGMVVSACIHPICMGYVGISAYNMMMNPSLLESYTPLGWVILALNIFVFFAGYVGSAALALAGLERRGLDHVKKHLFFMPLYWFLLSAAAWWSLIDLIWRPHFWAKTPHGLSKQTG